MKEVINQKNIITYHSTNNNKNKFLKNIIIFNKNKRNFQNSNLKLCYDMIWREEIV